MLSFTVAMVDSLKASSLREPGLRGMLVQVFFPSVPGLNSPTGFSKTPSVYSRRASGLLFAGREI